MEIANDAGKGKRHRKNVSYALVPMTWITVQLSWVKRYKINVHFYHLNVFVLPRTQTTSPRVAHKDTWQASPHCDPNGARFNLK